MKERSVFLCLVLTAMLTAFGCGDSSDGNGGDGGNGDGGSGGGGSSSACESLCRSSCVFDEVDPSEDVETCVAGCEDFYTDCDSELAAFVDCIEDVDCEPSGTQCQGETLDWVDCLTGGIF
jgi:hypothetical protein